MSYKEQWLIKRTILFSILLAIAYFIVLWTTHFSLEMILFAPLLMMVPLKISDIYYQHYMLGEHLQKKDPAHPVYDQHTQSIWIKRAMAINMTALIIYLLPVPFFINHHYYYELLLYALLVGTIIFQLLTINRQRKQMAV